MRQHIIPADSTIQELEKNASECEKRAAQESEPRAAELREQSVPGVDCSVAVRMLDIVIKRPCSGQCYESRPSRRPGELPGPVSEQVPDSRRPRTRKRRLELN